MATRWTPERRARQAALIQSWSPWEQSTGPRTEQGKAAASRNGWKGGDRKMLRELARAMREQRRGLERA